MICCSDGFPVFFKPTELYHKFVLQILALCCHTLYEAQAITYNSGDVESV